MFCPQEDEVAEEELVVQNYGKVFPDALIEVLIDTGEDAGLDEKELFELHLANLRGDERELVRLIKKVSEGVITSPKGRAFHSPVGSCITASRAEDLLTGIAARARVGVDEWIEKHAPPAISRAYLFDRKVRVFMNHDPEADFTLRREETDEDVRSLIARGLEAIEELP